jgi:hypothetical protein
MEMKTLFLIIAMLIPIVSHAHLNQFDFDAVVKTHSKFTGANDSDLEGSGLIFMWKGHWYVLTSEHVILPSNDGVEHFIEREKMANLDCRFAARYIDSSWDKGLALLQIDDSQMNLSNCFAARESFEYLRWSGEPGTISAVGAPAGTSNLVEKRNGQMTGMVPAGQILYSQPVARISNLAAEYGMSGGVAYSGIPGFGKIFGIVSHRNTQNNSETFVIPINDALDWFINRPAPEFRRTVDEFGKLSFSVLKQESVTQVSSGKVFLTNGPVLLKARGE